LHTGKIAEGLQRKHLGLERAVEAFVLASTLRLIGPAVQDIDAELEQPNAQAGPNAAGVMQRRFASINDLPINEADRKYHWPLGRRPDDHPGLSGLGL
jgi:hypothetical protein